MSIDPSYIQSPIHPGYSWNGYFYPVDPSVQLGYWYNYSFYGAEYLEAGYDFTQTVGAYPCSFSQNAYQQLPVGSVPGYSYLQSFYTTFKGAQTYQLQLFQEYQQRMSIPAYPYPSIPGSVSTWNVDESQLPTLEPSAPTNAIETAQADPAMPTVPMNSAVTVYPSPSPLTTKPGQSLPGARPPLAKKITCHFCNQKKTDFKDILGKSCCMECLRKQYEKEEFYFKIASNPLPWSTENVYDVYTALRRTEPDLPIKVPFEHFICIGRNQESMPGYPLQGHIVGMGALCEEGGCSTHKLCKACAQGIDACAVCGEFISYEEPRRDEYHPECDKEKHCPRFDHPCDLCGKKANRRKFRPGAPKQEEKKEEEGKVEAA